MRVDLDNLRVFDNADVSGKRVLLRVDLNVPMAGGLITDDTRIRRVLPTVNALRARGAKIIIISHCGRPHGKRVAELSLKPVADTLRATLNGCRVNFVDECIGPRPEAIVNELSDGDIVLLENLRFHPGEEQNCRSFAKSLSALGDIFVNDAFSTAHRAHASTDAITCYLPSFAGQLMRAEIDALHTALQKPEKPVAAIIGGAKVSSKISVLTNIAAKVDAMIVGGAMANTFLYASGHGVGASLFEPELVATAGEILAAAEEHGCEVLLPKDAFVAREFKANVSSEVCDIDAVGSDQIILDAGPATIADLKLRLACFRTLLWNGPLGAFEVEPFGWGTFTLAKYAAQLTSQKMLTTIAGGGDTVAALNTVGVTQDFTYVSTAGGAFLEWLEGRELPGVSALARQKVYQLTRSA